MDKIGERTAIQHYQKKGLAHMEIHTDMIVTLVYATIQRWLMESLAFRMIERF
jgi:hypothetical protein